MRLTRVKGEEVHSRKQETDEKLEGLCEGTYRKFDVAENKMVETSQVGKARVVESLPCLTEPRELFTPRAWEGFRQLPDDPSPLSTARRRGE